MTLKKRLTPQKLKYLKKSFRNPQNIQDAKNVEEFTKITEKTLKDTLREEQEQEQLKSKSKIITEREMCLFLGSEFESSQLIDIIIEIHKNKDKPDWNSIKESKVRKSLKKKSNQQLCQLIKELCPDLMKRSNFIFFRNYLKNLKSSHVLIGFVSVAILGGLITYLISSREVNKQINSIKGSIYTVGNNPINLEKKSVQDGISKYYYYQNEKPWIYSFLNPFHTFKLKKEGTFNLQKNYPKLRTYVIKENNLRSKHHQTLLELPKIINTDGFSEISTKVPLMLKDLPNPYEIDITPNFLKTASVWLSGVILGTIPSFVNSLEETKRKASTKKKVQNLVNSIKKRNQKAVKSVRNLQHKIKSIKKEESKKVNNSR